jgi:uncharacterized membrane protein YbaN (DUF454 family)
MSHTLRTVAGILLLILAVIGWLLPVMPGWPLFLAALAVLGTDHVITKWCYRQMERGKQWAARFRRKKEPEPKV